MLANLVVLSVILSLLSAAVFKILKDKRQGVKCAGCPYARTGCGSCAAGNPPGALETTGLTLTPRQHRSGS
jgi:hypothetical protein